MEKLVTLSEAVIIRKEAKRRGKKVVFTNGCFDILHAGHIYLLRLAKLHGDILIVGLNSDASVRIIKGEKRPIISETYRSEVLSSLKFVDYIVLFYDATPIKLINAIVPDVLIKGGDWKVENIVGRNIVEEFGGKVVTLEPFSGISTTKIIETIIERYK